MEAQARVERVEAGRVWVKVSDEGRGCGRCDEPGGCRSIRITDALGRPSQVFTLATDLPLSVGDRVLIHIPDGAPLRAALVSYGLGAVLLLLGAALGKSFAPPAAVDLWAAIGAGAGLALAYAGNRILARSRNWRAQLRMEIAADSACTHFSRES